MKGGSLPTEGWEEGKSRVLRASLINGKVVGSKKGRGGMPLPRMFTGES